MNGFFVLLSLLALLNGHFFAADLSESACSHKSEKTSSDKQ